MGGSSKKKSFAPDSLASQCNVTNVDKLARKCSHALKQELDLKHEVFHVKRERSPTVSLYFFSTPKVEAEIRGENNSVLPLPSAARWLHVAIDLKSVERNLWRVAHVSIGLLQGESSSTLKKPMLRAEWQIHEKADDSGHAQPHWHVLGAAGIDESDFPNFEEIVEASSHNQFEDFLAASPPKIKADEGFPHFHYAMVTDWHITPSQGPCRTLDSEAALVSWLRGCVRYIRHQLEHIQRKSGATAADAVT